MLLFVQLIFFCLKFAFVVFRFSRWKTRGFLADISHPRTRKDWSSAVLCKSEVMRVKFIKIRPFANKAVISSGFENSFKNCLFYLQRIHDVIAIISRQQYMQIKFESMQARQVVSSRLRRSFVRLRRSKRRLGASLTLGIWPIFICLGEGCREPREHQEITLFLGAYLWLEKRPWKAWFLCLIVKIIVQSGS